MPLPPPSAPPPPPPPIEDIPQRGPGIPTPQQLQQQQQHILKQQQFLQQQRHLQFGPQIRGNYSDVDNLRRGNYSDHDNVRRQYSDPESCVCRGSNFHSDGDNSDFEPHYIVQTPTGNVFVPQSQGLYCLSPSHCTLRSLSPCPFCVQHPGHGVWQPVNP